MTNPVISLKDIVFRYNPGKRNEYVALDGVSLKIPAGAVMALVGPSGSGKSTLLSVAALLDRPHQGQIIVDDMPLPRRDQKLRRSLRGKLIGVVTQRGELDPSLTAAENLLVPMRLLGHRDYSTSQAEAQLERLGICTKLWHRLPHELSGGEKQRVAIARALAKRPRVIFADEPTAALDSENADSVMKALTDTSVLPPNCTLFFVTHNEELVQRYADRVIRMQDGRILKED